MCFSAVQGSRVYHLRIKLEIMDANSKIVPFSPTVINSSFTGISAFLWSQTTK